jgi:hypothetical protein
VYCSPLSRAYYGIDIFGFGHVNVVGLRATFFIFSSSYVVLLTRLVICTALVGRSLVVDVFGYLSRV